MATELTFGTHLARYPRHFGGKRTQLVHHGVDGFFQLENFAAGVHGDFAGEVAVGYGNSHFRDVAHLVGQVVGHGIYIVGEILPHARYAFYFRLATELSFRAHFPGNSCYLCSEHAYLFDHLVDDFGGVQEFALQLTAFDFQRNGLREIAFGHGSDAAGDFCGGPKQVVDQRVYRSFHCAPGAGAPVTLHALAGFTFLAHSLANAFKLLGDAAVGCRNIIECVSDFAFDTGPVSRQTHTEIAIAHGLQGAQQNACVVLFVAAF